MIGHAGCAGSMGLSVQQRSAVSGLPAAGNHRSLGTCDFTVSAWQDGPGLPDQPRRTAMLRHAT